MMAGKPWTSTRDQTRILASRGLVDALEYEHYLSQVGYYRLSGYSYPLRQFAPENHIEPEHHNQNVKRRLDSFIPSARMSHVVALYEFDEQLRLALWQALSKLEIALRFDIGHIFGKEDPYLHMHLTTLWKDGGRRTRAEKFARKLANTQQRSSEEFVKHHHAAYHDQMPIWVVTEILEFGSLVNLYSLAPFEWRKTIADLYQARTDELESWLRTMNYLRNICAHHGRLWNRQLVIRPSVKYRKHDPKLGECLKRDNKIFTGLSLAAYLLEHKELTEPIAVITNVLESFPPDIPQCSLADTGTPAGWQHLALWSPYCT